MGGFSFALEVVAAVLVDDDVLVVEMVAFYDYLACQGIYDHKVALEVSHHQNWQPR